MITIKSELDTFLIVIEIILDYYDSVIAVEYSTRCLCNFESWFVKE